MKIIPETVDGRKTWRLDNDALTLTVMQGGGHFQSLALTADPSLNPFWTPHWKSMEPWRFQPKRHAAHYQIPLLAGICGHNICFAHFGDPSPEEAGAGLGTHGEAPVRRWNVERQNVSRRGVTFAYGCRLPIAEMTLTRRILMPRGSHVIHVRETVRNLTRRDVPFGLCQHVTFGAPFLEPGVTRFDMSATRGHTFPGTFGTPQRLRNDMVFAWPEGPGRNGKPVDLRTMRQKPNSDFSAQMMDPARENAWFSAVNPGRKLLVAYVWKRSDFPWLGNWEENYARNERPWNGKTLARGMEFSTSPFPSGLQSAVAMNPFQGQPTYRWLPARGTLQVDYALMMMPVNPACKGVADITPCPGNQYQIDLIQ